GFLVQSLIAAHALARAVLPAMSNKLAHARADGLAVNAGRPDAATVGFAGAFALVVTLLSLPWLEALGAALVVAACALGMAWLAQRQIGGGAGGGLRGAGQGCEDGVLEALGAALVVAACALGMAWLAQRQIGGVTGDVLGAAEQVCETAILVLLAAWLA